ncbi:hypothetical protein ABZ897_60310 [Nonomuraea sp. NPDC046802]|uniref:hypothetical protein n=1 Tax=Nonomuraea sp. NPDC046802 TaxID=3154919 RepID=UPI0033EAC565
MQRYREKDAEIDRLKSVAHKQARMVEEITSACMAAEREAERLRAQVTQLTSLLSNPDQLADHLSELRAVYAETERNLEIDRLADGG